MKGSRSRETYPKAIEREPSQGYRNSYVPMHGQYQEFYKFYEWYSTLGRLRYEG